MPGCVPLPMTPAATTIVPGISRFTAATSCAIAHPAKPSEFVVTTSVIICFVYRKFVKHSSLGVHKVERQQ